MSHPIKEPHDGHIVAHDGNQYIYSAKSGKYQIK